MHRRGFVTGAAGLATAPALLGRARGATSSKGSSPARLFVGQGKHRYECIHDWGRLPESITYGLTHGIVVDKNDHVHVLHTSTKDSPCRDTVVEFDPAGRFIRSWGAEFADSAHGFDLIPDEKGREILYITDQKRGLYKTTLDGKIIWHVEKPDFYKGKNLSYSPSNVAVTPDGVVYLSDGYGSYYIHQLDPTGRYIKTFGGPGHDKGQTTHPHGLFVDTRGKQPLLVVAENPMAEGEVGRLQSFTLDGQHHGFWDVTVRSPRHFARQGGLVAIPDLDARVTLLDQNNKAVAQLGDGWTTKTEIRTLRLQPRDQFLPGKFVCPHDAAFDSRGNLYISEWVVVGRITKLRKV